MANTVSKLTHVTLISYGLLHLAYLVYIARPYGLVYPSEFNRQYYPILGVIQCVLSLLVAYNGAYFILNTKKMSHKPFLYGLLCVVFIVLYALITSFITLFHRPNYMTIAVLGLLVLSVILLIECVGFKLWLIYKKHA